MGAEDAIEQLARRGGVAAFGQALAAAAHLGRARFQPAFLAAQADLEWAAAGGAGQRLDAPVEGMAGEVIRLPIGEREIEPRQLTAAAVVAAAADRRLPAAG